MLTTPALESAPACNPVGQSKEPASLTDLLGQRAATRAVATAASKPPMPATVVTVGDGESYLPPSLGVVVSKLADDDPKVSLEEKMQKRACGNVYSSQVGDPPTAFVEAAKSSPGSSLAPSPPPMVSQVSPDVSTTSPKPFLDEEVTIEFSPTQDGPPAAVIDVESPKSSSQSDAFDILEKMLDSNYIVQDSDLAALPSITLENGEPNPSAPTLVTPDLRMGSHDTRSFNFGSSKFVVDDTQEWDNLSKTEKKSVLKLLCLILVDCFDSFDDLVKSIKSCQAAWNPKLEFRVKHLKSLFLHLGSDGDVNLEAFVFGVELFALVSQGAHSGLSLLNQMGSDKN